MSLSDAADVVSGIRSCVVLREAVRLAGALGEGKPAGTAVRRAANRALTFGVGAGLIGVSGGTIAAVAGVDVAIMDDGELLRRWLAGVRAVCEAETPENAEDGVVLLVLSVLEVLAEEAEEADARQADREFWADVDETAHGAAAWYGLPAEHTVRARGHYGASRLRGGGSPALIELLAGFGMVSGDQKRPRVTALGLLSRDLIPKGMPTAADPGLPAAELLAGAADLSRGETQDRETLDRLASRWVLARKPEDAAREVLAAASGMSSAGRLAAVRIASSVGRAVVPVWTEFVDDPAVGPHARANLPGCETDFRWLTVEYIAAELDKGNADEVLTLVWQAMPGQDVEACLAAVADTGHPAANAIAASVRGFLASGAPRSIDQVLQVRVTLKGADEETWRSVRVPASDTLCYLHDVIQVAFGRLGEDRPYWFTVGNRRYGDATRLKKVRGDSEIRVAAAMAQAEATAYVWDPDMCWEHEIMLERTLPRDPGQRYPACVAFAGTTPPRSSGRRSGIRPFEIDEVNRRLAAERNEVNRLLAESGEPGRWLQRPARTLRGTGHQNSPTEKRPGDRREPAR